MLQFTGVQKSYGPKTILNIPSLELPSGVYWLQGANGTGKTTLLRMLAGILPFQGNITLRGLSLRREGVAYRRSVGWADAEPLYPDFLTGMDLLHFYRDILRPAPGQPEDLTGCFGVSSWLDSRAGIWSAGMCKRVSLLLAFIGRPALILLDEPLVTLDREGVAALYALIAKRHRDEGVSFILSSHQLLAEQALPEIRELVLLDRRIELT
jgi:ABC-2 type transport system ATP-binding protein